MAFSKEHQEPSYPKLNQYVNLPQLWQYVYLEILFYVVIKLKLNKALKLQTRA